jgi:hypothetical protein
MSSVVHAPKNLLVLMLNLYLPFLIISKDTNKADWLARYEWPEKNHPDVIISGNQDISTRLPQDQLTGMDNRCQHISH